MLIIFLAVAAVIVSSVLGLSDKKRRRVSTPAARLYRFPSRVCPAVAPVSPPAKKVYPVTMYPVAPPAPAVVSRKPTEDLKEKYRLWKESIEHYDALQRRLSV